MVQRRHLPLVVAAVVASMGAAYRTQNFLVEAPTREIAQQIGDTAEYYRKEKAIEWLGQEMPRWPDPCPLKVTVKMSGPGGATSFNFDQGRVFQHMEIEGPLDRLLASVLPHEVTHTVFAHYFRRPVPRWADEGGAVLSEDNIERARHDQLVRHILNSPGRSIQLRALFNLRDYPRDVMSLYAEGFSVVNFLVSLADRQTFLHFVWTGMQPTQGWDYAAQAYYHFRTIEELEQAWLNHLRSGKLPQPALLAKNTVPSTTAEATSHVVVRQTVPPVQPFAESPRAVFRGQASEGEVDERAGGRGYLPRALPAGQPSVTLGGPEGWKPAAPHTADGPAARLGVPEYITQTVPQQSRFGSPVGCPQ